MVARGAAFLVGIGLFAACGDKSTQAIGRTTSQPNPGDAAAADAGESGVIVDATSAVHDAGLDELALPVACDDISTTEYDNECVANGVCAERPKTIQCFADGQEWTCYCDGITMSVIGEVEGDEACRRAIGYCPISGDQFACPYEPQFSNESCVARGMCTYNVEVNAASFELSWNYASSCLREEDYWLCYCGGVDFLSYAYRLLQDSASGIDEVCAAGTQLCTSRERPALSEVEECSVFDVQASDTSCSFSSSCFRQPVEYRAQQIAIETAQIVTCKRDEADLADWQCGCSRDLPPNAMDRASFIADPAELLEEQAAPCRDFFVQECEGVLD